MTRLEYAQDLINRGLQKEEFISLMDKFDSGEEVLEEEVVDVEKPTGVAEVTADETPQTEAVNTESFLENVSSALQSTEEKELNELSPENLVNEDGDPEKDKEKLRISTTSPYLTAKDWREREYNKYEIGVEAARRGTIQLEGYFPEETDRNTELYEDVNVLETIDVNDFTNFNIDEETSLQAPKGYELVALKKTDKLRTKFKEGEETTQTLTAIEFDDDHPLAPRFSKGLYDKESSGEYYYVPIYQKKDYDNKGEVVEVKEGPARPIDNDVIEGWKSKEFEPDKKGLLPQFDVQSNKNGIVHANPGALGEEVEVKSTERDKLIESLNNDNLTLDQQTEINNNIKVIDEEILTLQQNQLMAIANVEILEKTLSRFDKNMDPSQIFKFTMRDEEGNIAIRPSTYTFGIDRKDFDNDKDYEKALKARNVHTLQEKWNSRDLVKTINENFGNVGLVSDFNRGNNTITVYKNGVYFDQGGEAGLIDVVSTAKNNGLSLSD